METEAALVHNLFENPNQLPKMVWSTNMHKLACMTMFTIFFAGNAFAPKTMMELIKAIVAADLHDSVVVGYDTFNEPPSGYINWGDLTKMGEGQGKPPL